MYIIVKVRILGKEKPLFHCDETASLSFSHGWDARSVRGYINLLMAVPAYLGFQRDEPRGESFTIWRSV
jgi:hypothetical protein